MNRTNEFGIHAVRKDVLAPERWDALIKPLDVRHTAAENNYVGIQDVDHMSQTPRQSVLVSAETCFGRLIIGFRLPNDVRRLEVISRSITKIPGQARPR